MRALKSIWVWVFAVGAVGLIVFAFADLGISIALCNEQSGFGQFFRVAGDLPMFAFFPLFSAVVFWLLYKRASKNQQKRTAALAASLAFVVLASGVFGYRTLTYIPLTGAARWSVFVLISAAVLALSLLLFAKTKDEALRKWFWVLLVAVIFALLSNLAVQILKIVWGRVRFRNLIAPEYADFTPWYKPNFFSGNKSFPSGHTTSACAFLIVPWIAKVFGLKKKYSVILTIFSIAFIFSTALSRIILGAHFASDTLAAVLICYSILIVTRKRVSSFTNFTDPV